MEIDASNAPVVKEFRFYPDSEIVTVVFGDDTSEDFTGRDNYQKARDALGKGKTKKAPAKKSAPKESASNKTEPKKAAPKKAKPKK